MLMTYFFSNLRLTPHGDCLSIRPCHKLCCCLIFLIHILSRYLISSSISLLMMDCIGESIYFRKYNFFLLLQSWHRNPSDEEIPVKVAKPFLTRFSDSQKGRRLMIVASICRRIRHDNYMLAEMTSIGWLVAVRSVMYEGSAPRIFHASLKSNGWLDRGLWSSHEGFLQLNLVVWQAIVNGNMLLNQKGV